jgi:YesN/AraC family two-component response regulator
VEALAAIADRRFDLVITDVLMPEMDGLQLIRRIREQRPYTRILAVSGGGRFLPSRFCAKLADDLGAEVSITKPLSEDVLLRGVDLALTRPIVA